MFFGVFQRGFGKGSLIVLTLLLVVAAGTVSAVRPLNVFAASTDTCGYNPLASPAPGGGTVIFNENTITRATAFFGFGLAGRVGVFTNDESGLYIGDGGTPSSSAGSSVGTAGTLAANTTVTSIPVPAGLTVAVSSGDTITVTQGAAHTNFTATANAAAGATSISVQSKNVGGTALTGGNISDPSIVWGQAVPPTFGTGSDTDNRPFAPTIYLTDITSNSSAMGGDWQNGGHPGAIGASAIYGSWSPTLGTKPVNSNDWTLGPNADPIPSPDAFGGVTTSFNEGYASEVRWNVNSLTAYDPTTGTFVAVQPGHTYRAQSITHDTDENKGNGDVGEVCTTFHIPVANLTITKTADASPVNAGDQIGFTVEVKNTGDDAAVGAALNDALPAGSGTGVTWAVDNSTGTPAKFVLSGAKGSQTLGLASSIVPINADYTIHITASTSATACGTYDNTATLTSTQSNPPPASASEVCQPAIVTVTKTADASPVNAGDQVGFTVEVKNTGTGLAKGVNLSDPLPAGTGTGVTWAVDNSVGTPANFVLAGAKGSQTLSLAANTLPAGADYTIHITAMTSFAECSTYNNTATLTTTNANNPSPANATETCNPSAIHILKTPDAAQVNAGEQIGFTLTVWNSGAGDAKGTTLNDPLPTNAGLSWTIANQGAGWGGTCLITAGTLNCGPKTVAAGTTQAGSTFTVHITSTTTSATGGVCPGGSGVVDNTGNVTTTNGGSDQSNAKTCVAAPVIKIVKTADAAQVNAGDQIGFTVTVFNTGTGDATGVNLSDPLPTNAGLSWTIASQGAGWASSCAITLGTLNCGPVTVAAGTTQAASTFKVHITSPTTAATGGSCPNTGVVNNTASVTTTNDGSDQSSASVCVAAPSIQIVKTADAVQVNAGDQIGFTVTVFNTGTGDAKGVSLSDPLPTNAGLNWQIASQGSGWASSCAITLGTLNCGPVTVPFGTTQIGSSFTVHITSTTTAATGGVCPGGSGVVNNTGFVTTTNDGSGQSSASTCVAGPSIKIVKTADAAQVNAGEQIGFTVTVYNTGSGDAKGVSLNDPLPTNAGLSWTIANQGAGWASTCAIVTGTLSCGPVTVPAGTTQAASTFTVHITSTTTTATGGVCPGGSGVVDNTGTVTTTNDGSGQSSASTCVAAPAIHIVKTADAAQVNAGDQIGFTLTVWNSGSGDAKGVSLSDPLPTNAGLSWTIASQGSGWASSCAIAAGTLTCGPVTVPAGTTQAGSTFKVHITSPTTSATGGVCPGGSGVVNNTGNVTTTNDGSDQSSASTCVAGPSIKIVKTADAAQVNAGDQIGFTLTVYNTGSGDAKGVSLSDPLPTNAGLSWTIASQGAGWASTCAIVTGTLSCGPVTVPAGTTQAASTFTVHITSTTTAATGGVCPGGSGVVNNTGNVTTTNDGSDQSTASTCVASPSIQIVKTADAAQVNAGDQIGFTVTVYNTGTGDAKGVNLSDPLPTNAGLNWQIANQGAGWGGTCAITTGTLNCGPKTVAAGTTQAASTFTVHITSTTTAATGGSCPNTGVVDNTGSVTTTNDGSGQSSASVCVAAPSIKIVKTADAAQVNAGDQIGFTVTVYNTGTGDAKGVNLSDPLPTNAGLNWQIANQGAGWGGTCAITGGTLSCGPVTVPAGTTQAGSSFTVHITSTTTAATGGVCPGGSGVVDNTGSVTTTNDGSGQSSASTCVAGANIQIVKSADAAQVNQGDPIGFTMTVYNPGTGDAKGVNLSDPLPTNTGLSWTIASQGAGWGGTCSITGGTLNCGPVTVPGGTTKAASTFTVHITSPTGAGTGGLCPETGVVDNTGSVTTTNDGSGQSSASTCVEGVTDLQITKTGSPATQTVTKQPYGNITWTMVVTNNGPDVDTNVNVTDPMPAGNTFVSVTTTKGTCTGGAILSCSLGTMQVGDSVTITLVTTPTVTGDQVNTATVVGNLPESNTTNNTATATVKVIGNFTPPPCTAVFVLPKQLYVGRTTKMHITVTSGHQLVHGVRVQIKGPGLHVTTKPSNANGRITQKIHPKKAGVVTFKPIVKAGSACKVPRIGITGVFTPPVTG